MVHQSPNERGESNRFIRRLVLIRALVFKSTQSMQGQLLIESLVAITVIAVAILGIFTLSSRSISLNRVVSDQYTATYLAAEGIEVVKNIIDSNVVWQCDAWNNGIPGTGKDYTVNWDSESLTEVTGAPDPMKFNNGLYEQGIDGEETRFRRKIRLENGANQNSLSVISTVEWEGRGGAEFEVILEDIFYNWRPFADNCTGAI
ncbi:MAG: hypothetical protein Q8Q32_02350 [bacterium]|nr:hypothetical protein [bacterium]